MSASSTLARRPGTSPPAWAASQGSVASLSWTSSRSRESTVDFGKPAGGTSATRFSVGSNRTSPTYSAAAVARAPVRSSPGSARRRDGSTGTEAISLAGKESPSSVGVGACSTSSSRGCGTPDLSTGTAQTTLPRWVSQRWSTPGPRISTTSPSAVRVQTSPAISASASHGRASSRSPISAESPACRAATSTSGRSGRRTSVSKPAGTSACTGQGRRRTGTSPSRPAAARVRSAEKAIPPVVETTWGSSETVRTAANPTPNRPTVSPSLPEARSDESDSTPRTSSGAPVLANRSSPSTKDTLIRPGVFAAAAASAAFCASSTNRRSR